MTPIQRALVLTAVTRAGSRRALDRVLGFASNITGRWLTGTLPLSPEAEARVRAWLADPTPPPERVRAPDGTYDRARAELLPVHADTVQAACDAVGGRLALAARLGVAKETVNGWVLMRGRIALAVLATCEQLTASRRSERLLWARLTPLAIVRAVLGEPVDGDEGSALERKIRRGDLDPAQAERFARLVEVVRNAEALAPKLRAEHYMRMGGEA
jgi:DNA-binding transcriptional regulator YdaS (Cro superfamily)